VRNEPMRKALGQYMTPAYAAERLVEQFLPNLTRHDFVIEPTCGDGAFLQAIPDHVQALGIEIDPVLADIAREQTGRKVITGDFCMVDINAPVTHVIGNPPFKTKLVEQILDRCHLLLPEEGTAGFILPCFVVQTAGTVARISQNWHMEQMLLPRNLFPRLQYPLCFVRLRKGAMRGLVGFALYEDVHQVTQLQKRYRDLLSQGVRATWRTVVLSALEALGGRGTLAQIYAEVEGRRHTPNAFWKEKVRQVLQRVAVSAGNGTWQLPSSPVSLAA